MTTRAAVIAEAESWLGTPYHHQARLKGVGVDCAMLLCAVYYAAGLIPNIDPRPYPSDWMLHRSDEIFLGWLTQYGSKVEAPKPGDAAVWRFGRCFSHGGIMVDDHNVIHAYRGRACVRSSTREHELIGRDVIFFSLWEE